MTETSAPAPTDTATEAGTPAQLARLASAEIQRLVLRAQSGDRDAYAALYTAYAEKIHAYLRYHLNHRSEVAEDLTADVFLKAMEKITSYQFNGVPFSAWLYRIAHNRLIDFLRAQPKKRGVSLDACVGADDPFDPSAKTSAASLDQLMVQEQLGRALRGLTWEQRQVLVYRILQDKSLAETGRLLGKQEDAVKQLQVRALQRMRRTLAA